MGWRCGARVQLRTATPPPRRARRSPRPGARAPPPGLRVSAPGPKQSRVCAQVGRLFCRKSGKGERVPEPSRKGESRKHKYPRREGGRLGCGAALGPHTTRRPPDPPPRCPGMNEAPRKPPARTHRRRRRSARCPAAASSSCG